MAITLEELKNTIKDIKDDDEWVNDSHTKAEHKGVCKGLDMLIRNLEEVAITHIITPHRKIMKKPKVRNMTHNGVIDVWDYVSFEEYPNEYGKRIYLDIQGLVESAEHELKSNKRYKNYEVESYGVKRWEC